MLLFLSLGIAIVFIGYFGIKQKAIYSSPKVSEAPLKKTLASSSNFKDEKSQLETLLSEKKLYLQARLSLDELAQEMKMSTNQVSLLINEGYQKSFYDLINEMRVEEVKRKIADPDFSHHSLLGIGLECGFNSKSSFNLIFKKFSGLTPSQYKKSLQEKKS